jgi:glycosyltransferase involved in cell wall biosynthesis
VKAGASAARNAGLETARGEFIFFMDDDNLIPVYTLHRLIVAAENFDAGMSRGRMSTIAENSTVTEIPQELKQNKVRFFEHPMVEYPLHAHGLFRSWYHIQQCLFRHSAIKDIRFIENLHTGRENKFFMYEAIASVKSYVQIDSIVLYERLSKRGVPRNSEAYIKMFDTSIPYLYQKYTLDTNTDHRLALWIYQNEASDTYRLVRDTVRSGEQHLIRLARATLANFADTPELLEILNRWGPRQRWFYRIFMKERFQTLRLLSVFM